MFMLAMPQVATLTALYACASYRYTVAINYFVNDLLSHPLLLNT